MTDLEDLVALSLVPSWWWRTAAERLRAGEPPRDVLDRLLTEHGSTRTPSVSTLRSRASTGLARAATAGLTPLIWRDRNYPSALAAIFDPPFVLWTRGATDGLNGPAVARK